MDNENIRLSKKEKVGKDKNLRKKALLSIINLLILQCVKENPITVHKIMNKIQGQFDVKISPSTIYSILSSLKKHGLVYMKIYKKRKLHFLTNRGKIASKTLFKDYANIQKKISYIISQKNKAPKGH